MILLGIRPLRDLVATLPVHRRHHRFAQMAGGTRGERGRNQHCGKGAGLCQHSGHAWCLWGRNRVRRTQAAERQDSAIV